MVLDSAKAREKLESCADLPTLPHVATKIVAMANSPQTNAADVGKMIEQDAPLTSKVLRLVNSAFYGFPGQIKTVQHAVVILGFNKVKNVVMTASFLDLADGKKSKRLNIPRFCEHSLGVAIAARVVCEKIAPGLQPDDVFVAGLLHDLGKLVLEVTLPKDYTPAFDLLSEHGGLLVKAEREALGFDHTNVGNWVAEKWRLPRSLQISIRYHHKPSQPRENGDMTACVHLGDIVARSLDIGEPGDKCMPEVDRQVWKQYNLDYAFLDKTLEETVKELRNAREFFGLIEGGSA